MTFFGCDIFHVIFCPEICILWSSGGTAESLRVGSENMENLVTFKVKGFRCGRAGI